MTISCPEPEGPQIGVAGGHGRLDPVEIGADLSMNLRRRSCPNLHDPAPFRLYVRPALLRRRFPDTCRRASRLEVSRSRRPPGLRKARIVTLDGRYAIVERVASGGMGEVFRARDTVLAREVAIKVLHRSLAGDQAFVDRFRTEARAAAGYNIVAVFDWGSVDGIYYMVMEFVRGQSLGRC